MSNAHSHLRYMYCVGTRARRSPVPIGNYAPVISVDGTSPHRHAIIVDCWGTSRIVTECDDGRWHLAVEAGEPIAEFVFA